MQNFTAFECPPTNEGAQTQYTSHGEFLQAAALRYSIGKALHSLNIEQLKATLDLINAALLAYRKNEGSQQQ